MILVSLIACRGAPDSNDLTGPTETRAVSTLVYSFGDSTGLRLVLTNLDGSTTRTLPCPEFHCFDGEISPDGKQLVVTGANEAGVKRQYIMGTDGSKPRLVASNPIASMLPTWRHDGKAFYSYRPNGSANGLSRAYVTDVATGESLPIEPTALQSGLPTESPDGRQLVFASNRNSRSLDALFSLDLTSSSAVAVPITVSQPLSVDGSFNQPRFSPSGGEIAFTYYYPVTSSNFDIWIASRNGTNPRPLATSPMRESLPDWSPDGAYIAYLRSPALGINEIVIARAGDGSIVRTIPEPAGGTVNFPRWGVLR